MWLATTYGQQWAKAGLAVAFDSESIARYQRAMASPEAFLECLEQTSRMEDDYANMDWEDQSHVGEAV